MHKQNGLERAIYYFRTPKILAERMGITPQLISNWRSGRIKIPAYRAIQIERATKGEITIDDLIDVKEI